jgi:hypothetical protein
MATSTTHDDAADVDITRVTTQSRRHGDEDVDDTTLTRRYRRRRCHTGDEAVRTTHTGRRTFTPRRRRHITTDMTSTTHVGETYTHDIPDVKDTRHRPHRDESTTRTRTSTSHRHGGRVFVGGVIWVCARLSVSSFSPCVTSTASC